MAKKKIEEKSKEITSNSISYKGLVKIEYMHGSNCIKSYTVHNDGTAELFRFIANALAGNFNKSMRPQFIHTFYCDRDEIRIAEESTSESARNILWSVERSTCAYNVPLQTVQVRPAQISTTVNPLEKPYITEITFMIPYSQIRDTSNIICLYNTSAFGSDVKPLAYIILPEDKELTIEGLTNVAITWSMSVSNAAIGG